MVDLLAERSLLRTVCQMTSKKHILKAEPIGGSPRAWTEVVMAAYLGEVDPAGWLVQVVDSASSSPSLLRRSATPLSKAVAEPSATYKEGDEHHGS
jgi:hypothetical protein